MPNLPITEPRNVYNTFRGVGPSFIEFTDSVRKIERTFDEPTYLTFKLEFNSYDSDNNLAETNFDKFPQPLFSRYTEDDIRARNYYSTYQYLRDSNEMIRADMMAEFIEKWGQLQNNFQWYFQSISGLNSLMSIVPGRGKRVAEDARLTIRMLEAVDQRVTYLMNLYRKIAWDDVYQRWVLPDMMRYFRLRIYITEFRTFHRSNYIAQSEVNPETGQRFVSGLDEGTPMILNLVSNMVPTYILELERCEFDIESFNIMPDELTVNEAQMREVEFNIKVGNFTERSINPIFNSLWYDLIINGFGRTQQTGETILRSASGQAGKTVAEERRAQNTNLATESHQSGRPFVQTGNIDNIHNANPNYSLDVQSVNPTDPATWLGNTLTLGKAFVTNLVETGIDKAKTMKIPGLGISFNEAVAAIQSKNVFTLFGAARRAISETIEDTLPSQELESNLIDTQFRAFLEGIAESEATDDDALELQKAANIILNDQGQWEEIKDLSKATDLLSQALEEINLVNQIENPSALRQSYAAQTFVGTPIADGLVYEGLPTSTATGATEKDLEGRNIQQPVPGQATSADSIQVESQQDAELGSTDGTLPGGFQVQPSSQLGSDPGEALGQPEDGLGSEADGGIERPAPSSQLGSDAEGGLEQPALSESSIEGNKQDLPEPGEAVDDDPIDAKPLPQPPPSQATTNDLQQ